MLDKNFLPLGKCIRLYDEENEHKLTIMRCLDDEKVFDLAHPDGEVLYCGVDIELVEVLYKYMKIGIVE